MQDLLNLSDFEIAAKRTLPKPLFAYVSGAVEDGVSEAANRSSFSRYAFKPQVLVDVSKRDTSVDLFGETYRLPVGIAPMGISALTSYRGDLVMAESAKAAGAPYIMSGSSLIRLEEVMEAAPKTWFQAYLPGDINQIDALIKRIASAKVRTLVLTVDTPLAANRENNIRAGFSTPLRPSLSLAWEGITHPKWLCSTFLRTILKHGMPHFENNYAHRGAPILSSSVLRDFSDRGHLNWSHVESIRHQWKGALVIKGILSTVDAIRAKSIGIDGIIVSNHGGRQLDGSVSPLTVLPEIVEAVDGVTIMLDSGIRRGSDALKALALGAKTVFVGRPFNYAACVGGGPGVERAFHLIEEEISRNMGMLGVTNLKALTSACLLKY